MPTYAVQTDVSTDKSIAEIRRTLQRWNAEQFLWGEQSGAAMVEFLMRKRRIRLVIPMPDRNAREFTHTPGRGQKRSPAQHEQAYEQAVRQRWRALTLVIKAKLEAVEAGVSAFDTEWLGHIVLPNGATVADEITADIVHAYETNEMPSLLPGLKALER